MKTRRLAGIDIGTNTFRLLVGEVSGSGINEIHSERIMTRLGEGLSETGSLSDNAIDRSISALKLFNDAVSHHKADAVYAAGTSALREADNSTRFITRAKDEAGIDIRIISEEEEAGFAVLGMLMDMPAAGHALLIDIGGGSTEFISTKDKAPVDIKSIPLGAVYLFDKHIKGNPPSVSEIESMEEEIRDWLAPVTPDINKHLTADTSLIGTAGTITGLSAMLQGLNKFDHDMIHGSKVSYDAVSNISLEISGITKEERLKRYPVLEASRSDIIVTGTYILLNIMKTFGLNEMAVSNYGLREGILLDMYNKIL